MILLKDIKKEFLIGEKKEEVLKGINLHIKKGEFVAIMGVSGSGKSTLLNVIGLMDRPTSGEYLLKGESVAHLSDDRLSELRNAYIGFVFQQFYLVEYLNALENVLLPLLYSHKPIKHPQKKAAELLERMGLKGRFKNKPAQLSGGEQQRVAVARALTNEPLLILADEPSGNLDLESSRSLHELLFNLSRKKNQTIVIVTHNPELAAMADRVIELFDGRVKKETQKAGS